MHRNINKQKQNLQATQFQHFFAFILTHMVNYISQVLKFTDEGFNAHYYG